MEELRELLTRKLEWIETTRGQTHAMVRLSRDNLVELVYLLTPTEMVGSNLPKIEPHALVQGCCRSHPHENMSQECEQKARDARAAWLLQND